ncbi:MAG: reverse transcriptase domain-containing protein [Candidatus Vogelbacteria bacterium]|nr:reverse transcriptase domain-containing protein [Candidatus Vogelbacteria bacterium]
MGIEICWGGGLTGEVVHDIFGFEQIISLSNLFNAWREFKRNKGKRQDVRLFGFNLEDNLFALHGELKNGTYQPSAYTSFYIQDPKLRNIHKAVVRDRVVHQAIFRLIYHIFDRHFIFDSYSCRFNKGIHRGVDRLEKFIRQASQNHSRMVYVLKCDVKKFFDSIDQEILSDLIKEKIKDGRTISLVQRIIISFEKEKGKGLPLGNVTSQLFANIYLNGLDQFIKHNLKQKYYVRYCDDFIIVGNKLEDFNNLIEPINRFLNNQLKLFLHPNKIEIRKVTQGIDFLGYVILPHYRVLRTKTKRRVLARANSQNLNSYLDVLSHCRGYKKKKKIRAIPLVASAVNPKTQIPCASTII